MWCNSVFYCFYTSIHVHGTLVSPSRRRRELYPHRTVRKNFLHCRFYPRLFTSPQLLRVSPSPLFFPLYYLGELSLSLYTRLLNSRTNPSGHIKSYESSIPHFTPPHSRLSSVPGLLLPGKHITCFMKMTIIDWNKKPVRGPNRSCPQQNISKLSSFVFLQLTERLRYVVSILDFGPRILTNQVVRKR